MASIWKHEIAYARYGIFILFPTLGLPPCRACCVGDVIWCVVEAWPRDEDKYSLPQMTEFNDTDYLESGIRKIREN